MSSPILLGFFLLIKYTEVLYCTRSEHGAFIRQEHVKQRLIKVLSALAYF